jgi:hypothetical protein
VALDGKLETDVINMLSSAPHVCPGVKTTEETISWRHDECRRRPAASSELTYV